MVDKKIIERILFSIAIYSALGGLYILVNAWVHPESLTWPLSRSITWITEDHFGILCWITSFISFTFWNIIRK